MPSSERRWKGVHSLQDSGLDTYQANTALGLPEDSRDYTAAAQMLTTLGARTIRLLTNNPDKATQLTTHGITVTDRIPTGLHLSPSNLHYLRTKATGTPATRPHGLTHLPLGA
ncbi:hypothetical protein [Kitasatospora sp. McL0602]|uniref:hypothetical protein n=1 Tax=Kitasatospora sp. McL0602 TaxID=3439530 RepID=UPI003F8995E4